MATPDNRKQYLNITNLFLVYHEFDRIDKSYLRWFYCQPCKINEFQKTKANIPEADSGSGHTSKMELLVKYFNGFKLLNIFKKSPI